MVQNYNMKISMGQYDNNVEVDIFPDSAYQIYMPDSKKVDDEYYPYGSMWKLLDHSYKDLDEYDLCCYDLQLHSLDLDESFMNFYEVYYGIPYVIDDSSVSSSDLCEEFDTRSPDDEFSDFYSNCIKSGVTVDFEGDPDPLYNDILKRRMDSLKRSSYRAFETVRSLCFYNAHLFKYFVTLTFSPNECDRYDYCECSDLLHKWLDSVKHSFPYVEYVLVPEQHKDGAYHFHGLFSADLQSVMKFSGHYSASGSPIYNLSFPYGFTTATEIKSSASCSAYIAKYISKTIKDGVLPPSAKRFWHSRGLSRPRSSHYFMDKKVIPDIILALKKASFFEYHFSKYCYITDSKLSIIRFQLTKESLDSSLNNIMNKENMFYEKGNWYSKDRLCK